MQAGRRVICHGCGNPIDPRSDDALVEPVEGTGSHKEERAVWHQECFEHFLDKGEET
jgi:hypothetical protein